ncbi:glycoside hydrolase family 3 protein [Paenibacillus xylanilyticus]|uniref:glycoside hydrolase family 3 protein n=1 Tax=Paenibacillus xylanilyticus TaxID=248903 RepID=UPI0039A0FE9E
MNETNFDLQRYAAKARQAAAEGVVLLKNDCNVLPLAPGSKVALFGRSQFNYYKSGTGSGGLVNTKYVVGIAEALESKDGYEINQAVKQSYLDWLQEHPFDKGAGWGKEPWFQEEMFLDADRVKQAAKESEVAIIVLGRTAGEDQDNKPEAGSYLLTEAEEAMLERVCKEFERTVVLLNVGNIIDMKWVEIYKPSAVLYVWQGGQEGGNGVLDVLTGRISPSGRMTDTIARDIEDYPSTANHGGSIRNLYQEDIYVGYRYFETFAKDRVLYPFGFGLSYTTFETRTERIERLNDGVRIYVTVTNTGDRPGKQVVQVYCEAPQGKLGKPARVLAGFAKTKELLPGGKQFIEIKIAFKAIASYDDSGITGCRSAWVMEAGSYIFHVGDHVRDAKSCGSIAIDKLQVLEQLQEAMAPDVAFERMRCASDESLIYEPVPLRTIEPKARRAKTLPDEIPYTGDKGYKLTDVKSNMVSMEDYIAQLSDEDLCCIVRGEGMSSPKVTPGTAGAFGGVTKRLEAFGIPLACSADGPSGIRMDCGNTAFSMPNGTCLGCTFNEALLTELYAYAGLELRKNHVDTLLGPGMNIHRNPLNGRNFEYFSEDPFLTGRMVVAQLHGMNPYDVTGTIKHFACNSQEAHRNTVEAVVSERALREIYLRGFEMAVKEGNAISVMTSYNPINGFWSASNYDLTTTILRGEWGFRGIVMTDWWAKGNDEGEEGSVQNVAAMIRAQNDLFMVVSDSQQNTRGDNSAEALRMGTVTRGEYQRSAMNICNYLMGTTAFNRMIGMETELDKALAAFREEEGDVVLDILSVPVEKESVVSGEIFDISRGRSTFIRADLKERGVYRVELTCRATAENSELAQIPVSIFHDAEILQTITLTGADSEWKTYTVDIRQPILQKTTHFKFVFGQSGMEIKEFRIIMTSSLEERIQQALSVPGGQI